MAQGESSREKATCEILSLAADQKAHKSSEFVKTLKGKFAKNTVYKYLKNSVTEGLLEAKPGSLAESFKPRFLITKRGLEKVEKKMMKEKFSEWIDEMTSAEAKVWLARSMEEIKKLKATLWTKEERLQDILDGSIITLKALQKIQELSGKEFKEFSATKYMAELRMNYQRERQRRDAAMAKYARIHPDLESLHQGSLKELIEYIKGFEEYYKGEFLKELSAGSMRESG